MNLNLKIDHVTNVTIRGKKYPISVSGNGISCLSIVQGTLGQRTLSQKFKRLFKVYSSDLYFDERYALEDPSKLTMEHMVDDIAELAKQLKLTKFVIFGFSAFGLVALEFAKKYPEMVMGIIMVGTPLNSNPEVAARNNAYFEAHAEPERKKIDAERNLLFAQEDLSHLNYSQRLIHAYVHRYAPRNWYVPDFDCSAVWHDMVIDPVYSYFFSTILPQTDVMQNMQKVTCPVFLAAGLADYNCCPWMWEEVKNRPSHMVISRFEKSGHWPQYEEQELFDERIKKWAQNCLKD